MTFVTWVNRQYDLVQDYAQKLWITHRLHLNLSDGVLECINVWSAGRISISFKRCKKSQTAIIPVAWLTWNNEKKPSCRTRDNLAHIEQNTKSQAAIHRSAHFIYENRAACIQAAWPFSRAEPYRPCNPFRRVALAKINFSQWYIMKISCQVFFAFFFKKITQPYLFPDPAWI